MSTHNWISLAAITLSTVVGFFNGYVVGANRGYRDGRASR